MMLKGYLRLSFMIMAFFMTTSWCGVSSGDDLSKRCINISMLHGFDTLKERSNHATKREAAFRKKNHTLELLSGFSAFQHKFFEADTIVKTVMRIESLTKQFESMRDGEEAQQISFNLAYEYFILYLHYKHIRFEMLMEEKFRGSKPNDPDIPISEDELQRYLSRSAYYLEPFLPGNQEKGSHALKTNGKADSSSFFIKKDKSLYLNVNFLALMVACEKMVGGVVPRIQTEKNGKQLFEIYDQNTWDWLDELWRRYTLAKSGKGSRKTKRAENQSRRNSTFFTPSARELFSYYELYLRYHFAILYLRDIKENSPMVDPLNRTLLKRLDMLQKAGGFGPKGFYAYYLEESMKDGGNTAFLPGLFFARRGYIIAKDLDYPISGEELFDIFGSMFETAARKIKYNIPYRSRIYNDLILFGIEVGNLRIMEDVLYEYGRRSILISDEKRSREVGFETSSNLTMAYLVATILDRKRLSGLDHDSDQYKNMAVSHCPMLISKYNHNWQYAAAIHGALSMFYAGSQEADSGALALHHARQAFFAPCRKVSITYGNKGWKKFFDLPESTGAESYMKLFLYFQSKYSTSPDAVISDKHIAAKILNQVSGHEG